MSTILCCHALACDCQAVTVHKGPHLWLPAELGDSSTKHTTGRHWRWLLTCQTQTLLAAPSGTLACLSAETQHAPLPLQMTQSSLWWCPSNHCSYDCSWVHEEIDGRLAWRGVVPQSEASTSRAVKSAGMLLLCLQCFHPDRPKGVCIFLYIL